MKVELENVKPMEIEKRSFEIITEELGDKQLLVLCNDSDTNVAIPAEIKEKIHAAKNILIQNYKDTDESTLRPYEAVVYAL